MVYIYIFAYIYQKKSTIHVGKYTIHGWYGLKDLTKTMVFNHWDDSASITELGRAGFLSKRAPRIRCFPQCNDATFASTSATRSLGAGQGNFTEKKQGNSYLKSGSDPPPFLRENMYFQSVLFHNWVEIGEDEEFFRWVETK